MVASCSGRMQRVDIWAVEDADSPRSQLGYAFLECGMRSVGVVGKWQRDDGQLLADSFDQDAERESITYPERPFVDGIYGRWRDNDGIWLRQHIRRTRIFIVASHWSARQFLH